MENTNSIQLQVSHCFPYPAETVFDAWLDEKKASRFMFVTGNGELLRCEIDARAGGEFVMTDRRADGNVEHRGRYHEISRPHKLVFSFGIPAMTADEDLVTITIKPVANGCELTLVTEIAPQWASYADSARDAWKKIIADVEATLA